MSKKETHTITLKCKDPDEIGSLIDKFDLGERDYKKYFTFAEYATIELDVRPDLTIAAARFVKAK